VVKKATKQPRQPAKSGRFPLIEKELHKRTKAELVAMILAIAKEHAVVARELEDRLTIEKPVDLLVADTSSAIDRATDFDERMMNHNFDVDCGAIRRYRNDCSISTTAPSGRNADGYCGRRGLR
jgi:hypothetical protein